MASTMLINITSLKEMKDSHSLEKDNFIDNAYSVFRESYLNSCQDEIVSKMANKLDEYYVQINSMYDKITTWWSEYISNIEGLENAIASKNGNAQISDSVVSSFAASNLSAFNKFDKKITKLPVPSTTLSNANTTLSILDQNTNITPEKLQQMLRNGEDLSGILGLQKTTDLDIDTLMKNRNQSQVIAPKWATNAFSFANSLMSGTTKAYENLIDGGIMLGGTVASILAKDEKKTDIQNSISNIVKVDIANNQYAKVMNDVNISDEDAYGTAYNVGNFTGSLLGYASLSFLPGGNVTNVAADFLASTGNSAEQALLSGATFEQASVSSLVAGATGAVTGKILDNINVGNANGTLSKISTMAKGASIAAFEPVFTSAVDYNVYAKKLTDENGNLLYNNYLDYYNKTGGLSGTLLAAGAGGLATAGKIANQNSINRGIGDIADDIGKFDEQILVDRVVSSNTISDENKQIIHLLKGKSFIQFIEKINQSDYKNSSNLFENFTGSQTIELMENMDNKHVREFLGKAYSNINFDSQEKISMYFGNSDLYLISLLDHKVNNKVIDVGIDELFDMHRDIIRKNEETLTKVKSFLSKEELAVYDRLEKGDTTSLQGEWISKLTEQEKYSIRNYAKNFGAIDRSRAFELFGYDSNGRSYVTLTELMRAGHVDGIEYLDTAIEKFGILPTGIITYRGVGIDSLISQFGEIDTNNLQNLVGKIYTDKAYMSTSLLESRAYSANGNSTDVILKINVPNDANYGAFIESQSDLGYSQLEFLIKKNSNATITDAYINDRGKIVLEMSLTNSKFINNTVSEASVEKLEGELADLARAKGMTIKELGSQKNTETNSKEFQLEADSLAKTVYELAKANEPQITADLMLLESSDAKFVGLGHRLKTEASLSRKIISDFLDERNKIESNYLSVNSGTLLDDKLLLEDVSKKIGDSVRYTLLIDNSTYKETLKKSLDQLTEKGYKVLKFKNFWGDSIYQGVNASVLSPNGIKFELQFHTESSFHTKEELNHLFYEVYRNKFTEENEKTIAKQIMLINQSKVVVPNEIIGYNYLEVK